ncbi:GtrA family protein [bacterium]|nr:GtrA family protein [bacterium]
MRTPLLYISFALIATLFNLMSQEISYRFIVAPYELTISMLIGTLVGLIVKYYLDKKYIFKFTEKLYEKNLINFILYSCMGIFTTILFWITEFAFDYWFGSKTMRYVGAIIGLSIGYTLKYNLDRKFVFIER